MNAEESGGGAAIRIFQTWRGEFTWRLHDEDGAVIVQAVAMYDSADSCREAIDSVRRLACDASVSEGTFTLR